MAEPMTDPRATPGPRATAAPPAASGPLTTDEPLRGLGVSRGLAVGPAYRMADAPPMPEPKPVIDPDAETTRALDALATVAAELDRRASAATDPTAAEVLRAQSMMAEDPVLRDAVVAAVRAGLDAPHAVDAALAEHRAAFAAAGGYLAERVADLDDLRDRVTAVCLGRPMPGIPSPDGPFVLIARDLAPADTASLDLDRVLALVTTAGGPTSHTAILARSLGLPAVVSCAHALDLPDGTIVAVDGDSGEVRLGADADALAAEAARGCSTHTPAGHPAVTARGAGPGRTADGHPVALLCNVGSVADVAEDCEGIGLFRTELLFLNRVDAPGVAEQAAIYAKVLAAASGRRVVVRTLDAGADKPLPFLRQEDEPNPALGIRGLRIGRRRPVVLDTQLRAIADAAHQTGARVSVMAPMVATVAEAADFTTRCRQAGITDVGVMVEVPSAALRARQLLEVVDFLSVGTNDLSQYVFAADRQNGALAELLDPWQPALLALIAECAAAGRATGKPVGVCGEAAADPALAVVLAGLGVTSLSMSARAIPAVRDALAAYTLKECERLAAAALAADGPDDARRAVTD